MCVYVREREREREYISHNNNKSQPKYDNPNLTQEVIPCLHPTTAGFAALAEG